MTSTTGLTPLTRDAIARVDSSNLLGDVLQLPDHIRDAQWRVESARLEPVDTPGGLVVAGMGGSGVGAALAAAALGDQASRPILSAHAYGLPPWTTPDTTVLCASCSGDTEETLACYDAAGALGAPRIVTTAGGQLAEAARRDGVPVIPIPGALQPRSAVAYLTVAALEVAAMSGCGPHLRSELDVAAAHAEKLIEEWGPDSLEDSLAKRLARELHDTVPVVTGAGLAAPVAYRWKTQINENAKIPSFSHELPELDHNEIVGWQGAEKLGKFGVIFLSDADQHPRTRQRIRVTRELIDAQVDFTEEVCSRGETSTERMFSLVLLGDLVSVYLAVLHGVDPTPVSVIEELKHALQKPT